MRGKVANSALRQHTNNLNLDIDLNELLRKRIDLDKTRVDSAVESSKLRDQADIALTDRAVRVGTADAAGHGTKASDDRAKSIDCRTC